MICEDNTIDATDRIDVEDLDLAFNAFIRVVIVVIIAISYINCVKIAAISEARLSATLD